MNRQFYFITHPNVVISREVPVPRWPLSALGRERMQAGLRQPWMTEVSAIYCSGEQKAIDAAEIVGQYRGLPVTRLPELGENDRSATGFLPPHEFEIVADEFFARPEISVRGWERALDAQTRIVRTVEAIVRQDRTHGKVAILSHGAVGTLLHCHLAGVPIARRWDQPANGGGNYFPFTWDPPAAASGWQVIDTVG